jgi:hypothetical protein
MIHSEDLRIPIRMDVGPILWRTNHHELVVVGVDRVPVTTDVIGGVVDGQCLDRVDLIVGDPDRVPFVFGKHLGIVAVEISPEEPVQEVVFEFRHESLRWDISEELRTQEHERTFFAGSLGSARTNAASGRGLFFEAEMWWWSSNGISS